MITFAFRSRFCLLHTFSFRHTVETPENGEENVRLYCYSCFFFSSRKQETCALSKMSEPEKWLLTHTVHGWLAWLGLAWLSLAWLHASWCSLLLKTLLCVLTVESIKKFEYRILCCHDITNILYWMFNNSVNKKMAHKKSLLNINWNISAKFSAFVIFGSHTETCTGTARSLRTSTATDEWSVN